MCIYVTERKSKDNKHLIGRSFKMLFIQTTGRIKSVYICIMYNIHK